MHACMPSADSGFYNAEIIVENVLPDGEEWTLVDHLCFGETALLRCDGRWRFRVTAPPAAAGCAFVCNRRDVASPLSAPLPPLAPGPPRTSPLDMLLEASRIQPQCAPAFPDQARPRSAAVALATR